MKRWVAKSARHLYEFERFALDPERRRLLRDGEVIPLPPRTLDLLLLFVRNPGRVLDRQALLDAIWRDTIVEDANLTVAVSQLRKVLGENDGPTRFIETIPRIGYRFIAETREVVEEDPPLSTDPAQPSLRVFREEVQPAAPVASEPPPIASAVEPASAAPAVGGSRMSMTAWSLALLALLATCLTGWFVYRHEISPAKQSQPPPIRSIAVLPFKYAGATEAEDDYLALGLTDCLHIRLRRLKQFVVRPTSSVLSLGEQEQDPRKAGRDLRVDAVLAGLIQRDRDRVRLTARLLRVSDGALIWADSFEEPFTNLFEMEDAVSHDLAEALRGELTPDEQQNLVRRGTNNSQAFAAYLHGRYTWNKRTTQSTSKALKFFQQAIELDPTYAEAYVGMADCYLALGDYGDASPNESFPRARGAARHALEIDDSLADAHASLAQARFLFDWDWGGAEREFRRAIELNPNYATAHHWYAMFLAAMGREEEAMREIQRAENLDPLSLIIRANIGTIQYFARRYKEAIAQERKVLEADPGFVQARRKLAFSLEAAGNEKEAVAEWLQVEQQLGADEQTLAAYRNACASSGIRGYWLQAIEVDKKEGGGGAGALSSYYARLDDREQAFPWLEQAVDQRGPWLVYARVTPVYDNLRADPRFAKVLQRIGL